DITTLVQGRYYGTSHTRPVFKKVRFQTNRKGKRRRPQLEYLLLNHKLQPCYHHAIVIVKQTNHLMTRWHLFFKNHKYLPNNHTVAQWTPIDWKGDILVLKQGHDKEFVNMQGNDVVLAAFAVRRYTVVVIISALDLELTQMLEDWSAW
ncbi:hypothetical protein DXG01_011301, partial [Tephrocybe rancida]